jgi:hypothetical protein
LKLRRDKLDAARRELELRRARLKAASAESSAAGKAIQGASGEGAVQPYKSRKKKRKNKVRVSSGLDWHVINNDM